MTYPAVSEALAMVVVPRMDLLNSESLLTSSCKAFRELSAEPEKIDSNWLAAMSAVEKRVLMTCSDAFSIVEVRVADFQKCNCPELVR